MNEPTQLPGANEEARPAVDERTFKYPADALRAKWGATALEKGWTALPNTLIKNQRLLGLDPLEMNIILHLCSFWWSSATLPHPSKKTIAAAVAVDPRTVQRRIAKLEERNLIRRVWQASPDRRGGTTANAYDLSGLARAIEKVHRDLNSPRQSSKKRWGGHSGRPPITASSQSAPLQPHDARRIARIRQRDEDFEWERRSREDVMAS